ncbi:alanine dehydrogenase [Sneathiella glossodoripedis]|uniref:alanine dehydrogenase n=1 Tax=Sneathiella glossodoripedis TaxID=418853 RepID=UPI00046FC7AA|nr:alanine dehydrogenase [Sneathiella glossodoripedis]
MLIGVPAEIKTLESRIGMTPGAVREAVAHGHKVVVQSNGGLKIGLTNDDYVAAGATIADTAEEIFATADMIVKVKEPQPQECKMLREGQLLFTYLHLAPDPVQAQGLLDSGCTAIAYETVTSPRGGLPLLAPMSEVAGRMSIQAGAHCLEMRQGGEGILLGGVPGVPAANVVVLGGGVVGVNAARMAMGLGANVTVLDKSLSRLAELDALYGPNLKTIYSSKDTVDEYVSNADLVIGAVLIPGAAAPKLVKKDHLKNMKNGAVVVDVAIDQGGCFETSKATTHVEPTYIVDGVVHYCVANMPGGVARTSTFALNNATMPFMIALANKGFKQALSDDPHLREGLNVHAGKLTNAAVARDLGKEYISTTEAIAA